MFYRDQGERELDKRDRQQASLDARKQKRVQSCCTKWPEEARHVTQCTMREVSERFYMPTTMGRQKHK